MKIQPFKIEEWMNLYESSAKYDLTTTCIKPLSIRMLIEHADENALNSVGNLPRGLSQDLPQDLLLDLPLGYLNITGSERLKNNIKDLYKNQESSNITVTHGAIGANQLVFLSLLEKGDEVVSIVPTYQQHYSIPQSIGANVKLYFLREENNWLPSIEELSEVVSSKTKLICLNNPNNPTGSVIPNHMLEEIVNLAQKNNVWILSDEVYRGLNLIGKPYSNSISDLYDKGISVGSMSKTYSLPGLRVGWICAREDLINEVNHQRQYNTICVSVLDEYFASIALESKDWIQARNLELLRRGHEVLCDWLKNERMVQCVIPNGGTTAFVKYQKNLSSKELCKKLQYETGVALLPGKTMELDGYVRIGFCAENLGIALNIFSDFLHN